MPKFYKQNKKRIDPRYFLNEITDPMEDFNPQEAPDEQEVAKILKKNHDEADIDAWANTIASVGIGGTSGAMIIAGSGLGAGIAVAVLTTALFYYLMNNTTEYRREQEFTSLINSWMKDPKKMFRDVPNARGPILKKIEKILGQERAKERGPGFKFVPDEE